VTFRRQLLKGRGAVENRVPNRSEWCRSVVEDLAEDVRLLHLTGGVRLSRRLEGVQGSADGGAVDALLKLIAGRRNGWLDEPAWAQVTRDHLARAQGRAPE
jgi:hypothetical protein